MEVGYKLKQITISREKMLHPINDTLWEKTLTSTRHGKSYSGTSKRCWTRLYAPRISNYTENEFQKQYFKYIKIDFWLIIYYHLLQNHL